MARAILNGKRKEPVIMATTRIMAIHVGKSGSAQKAISRVIDYVENPDKTNNKQLVSSFQCKDTNVR